jgi:diamine N-acetyltransferase
MGPIMPLQPGAALEESMTVSEITIRSAWSADAASLSELAAETFPLACPPHTTAEAIAVFIAEHFTVARFSEYLGDASRTLLVAEEPDGRLVGYSMLIAGEPRDADAAAAVERRPTIELSKFYTRAAAHGTGVAAPLMAATVDAASAVGAVSTWLGVNEENARAIRFYEKHGFRKVGRKHFTVGGRVEDDWVLERLLG